MRIYLGLANYCNLSCSYCYRDGPLNHTQISKSVMKLSFMENLVGMIKATQTKEKIYFVLHGYEPLIVGLDYLKDLFSLLYASSLDFSVNIQSNLILLNNDVVKFFKDNNITVGTSLDGPKDIHDASRTFKNGKGSFDVVLKKISLLRENEIRVSIICIVTKHSLGHEKYIYDFFKEKGLDFTISPVIWSKDNSSSDNSAVNSVEYAEFFRNMFDLYVFDQDRKIHILCIDGYIKKILYLPTLNSGKFCYDDILFVDYNGSLYRCGRFAGFNDFCVGNINELETYEQIFSNKALLKYQKNVRDLSLRCSDCEIYQFCGGGCFYDAVVNKTLPNDEFSCGYHKATIPYMIEKVYLTM